MLNRIRSFFSQTEQAATDVEAALHLAAAALLIEVAKADHVLEWIELDRM